MFEFLFKYSAATFERADFTFASGWPVGLLIVLILLGAATIGYTLARRGQGLGAAKLAALGALQTLMLAIVLTLVWRPALVSQTLRPQENSVAVLLDTSESMSYGEGGQSRLQEAIAALGSRGLPELEQQFRVDLFSFADDTLELPALNQVPAPGPVTRIGDALLSVLRGVQSGALAAVVLVSDGADNSGTLDAARIAEIASFGVPVHTVGVGPEVIANDLELEDVSIPAIGLPGSTVTAQVSIRHASGGEAALKVYDGDAILASQTVRLPNRAGVTTAFVDIDVGKAGVRDLRFALDALPGEPNVVNNVQLRPMEVPEERRHVLYIEGEPRWEYKFMRRAMDGNSAVRLASLLRTTPNKFYRQGVESPEELLNGFPEDAETLFKYDALIIGSYEAAALSVEQQNMIRDFVSRRGGSLLMLGGRRGLADGGWGATAVAEVLPVRLPNPEAPTFARVPAKARLTAEGRRSAITRLAAEEAANAARWSELPEIADFQHVAGLKPGAVALLEAEIQGKTEPLLVQQRYGQGNAYVLATGGTWRWQMQLPHEDQRHETFWRQLMQALATAAPRAVTLTADHVFYGDETTVRLRAEVKDGEFEPADGAKVTVEARQGVVPAGSIELTPVPGERGVYEGTFEAPDPGIYRFEARAERDGETLGTARFAVRRQDGVTEHFAVQQNRALLERLAAATGGSYFTLGRLDKLPEAVRFSEAGIMERQILELWNMPILFLLLLALKAGEWLLRLFWGRL
ncbi:MAG TPA: glutamine amidotransferase [Gammaproteobacteria bacterium]